MALTPDPFIGMQVGRWVLVDFVGQGAMGIVYAGRPRAAIKILNARRAAMQPDLVRRFQLEARAAMQMTSPHIARVFDQGTTSDGHLYIAMELLRGEPLDAILRRSTTLPHPAVATIGYQVALALEEAHQKNIVHRDIKPANIFVEPADGGGRHVRVLDFGVARINSESVARSKTGSVAGTPAFMSPEQLRGDGDIDGRSDIYSLGVVLYVLLSGTNPFRGPGGLMQTLIRHLELEPPPIPGVPRALWALISRMLAKHRDDRPASMSQVRAMLSTTGLVGAGQDSATIPGISHEFLSMLGLYDVPDPEQQPLPAPTEHLTETHILDEPTSIPAATPPTITGLGAVKLEEQPLKVPRASRWPLVVVVLAIALVGAAVGLDWGGAGEPFPDAGEVGERVRVGSSEAHAHIAAAAEQRTGEVARSMKAARSNIKAERWAPALEALDQVLAIDPAYAPALEARTLARAEARNERDWQSFEDDIEHRRWAAALRRLDAFPTDSVYAARVESRRSQVEGTFVLGQLEGGRLLIAGGDLRGAAAMQKALAGMSVGQEEARRLAEQLETARSAGQPARRPDDGQFEAAEVRAYRKLLERSITKMTVGNTEGALRLLDQAIGLRPEAALPHLRRCALRKAKLEPAGALSACRQWAESVRVARYRRLARAEVRRLAEELDRGR